MAKTEMLARKKQEEKWLVSWVFCFAFFLTQTWLPLEPLLAQTLSSTSFVPFQE